MLPRKVMPQGGMSAMPVKGPQPPTGPLLPAPQIPGGNSFGKGGDFVGPTQAAPAAAQTATPLLPAPQLQKGPAAHRFGEPRPLLGNTTFRNLQPRNNGGGMLPRPSADVGPMPPVATEKSYAGFGSYLEEQTAGSPRRMGGRSRRAGARFTEGPMRGKTLDQAKVGLREKYASMSPEQKAQYEAKARNEDISTDVPAAPRPMAEVPMAPPELPDVGAMPMSLDRMTLTSNGSLPPSAGHR